MFTGIVEERGRLRRMERGTVGARLYLDAKDVLEGTRIGDSIAVNGVCLTVVMLDGGGFAADVMAETLRRSNLGALQAGDLVNLERAMPANGRFGGHIVSGHIDGVGTVRALEREDNAVWVTVQASSALLKYVVEKGSVAIDGISLTVAAVGNTSFQVSVIPHTGAMTTLLSQKPGDRVNIECDVIGKYVEKLLSWETPPTQKNGLSLEFLRQNGF